MIWLHNYARLQNLTADALSTELDLSKPEIRAALTDPDADIARFVRQVEGIRKTFEAALPDLADIEPLQILREGMALALKRKVPVEVVGPTRMGKTIPAFDWFMRHGMDRGVFFTCPPDESERNFIWELARALGIGAGTGKKTCQIVPQIRGCFGKGMLELIVVDEGHFLWPADQKAKPKRLEHLRSIYDMQIPSQVGIVILATPQFTISMNSALQNNARWAPGQWDGRVIRYHFPDTMTDADLEAVARHHAPEFNAGMIAALVLQAKGSHGFCGIMVNTIILAREKAELKGLTKVTPDILLAAQKQMSAGTKIEQIAKHLAKSDRRAA